MLMQDAKDLMLGIVDLHPEAIAVAESAMAGYQHHIRLGKSSNNRSEDEDSSDDKGDAKEDENHEQDTEVGSVHVKLGLKDAERDLSCQESENYEDFL